MTLSRPLRFAENGFIYVVTKIRVLFWILISPYISRGELIEKIQESYERYESVFNILFLMSLVAIFINLSNISEFLKSALEIPHILGSIFITVFILAKLLLSRSPIGGQGWLEARGRRKLITFMKSLLRVKAVDSGFVVQGVTCQFADNPEIVTKISFLNVEAFSGSSFGMKKEELFYRNEAICEKNPTTNLLIFDPSTNYNTAFGFITIIPLTKFGFLEYMDGRIHDSRLKARDVCGLNENPEALLIFSIAIHDTIASIGRDQADQIEYLFGHLAFHLVAIAGHSTSYPDVEIIMQTEHEWAKRIARIWNFTNTQQRSADGFDIWSGNLSSYLQDPVVVPVVEKI